VCVNRYFNGSICRQDQGGAEDVEMGWFLFYHISKYIKELTWSWLKKRKLFAKFERLDHGHTGLKEEEGSSLSIRIHTIIPVIFRQEIIGIGITFTILQPRFA
jgi:hypothetical protein